VVIDVEVFCESCVLLACPATTALTTLSLHDALPIYFSTRRASSLTCSSANRRRSSSVRASMPSAVSGSRPGDYTPSGLCIRSRRSEEHTSELQSRENLVCRLLLEKKKKKHQTKK